MLLNDCIKRMITIENKLQRVRSLAAIFIEKFFFGTGFTVVEALDVIGI